MEAERILSPCFLPQISLLHRILLSFNVSLKLWISLFFFYPALHFPTSVFFSSFSSFSFFTSPKDPTGNMVLLIRSVSCHFLNHLSCYGWWTNNHGKCNIHEYFHRWVASSWAGSDLNPCLVWTSWIQYGTYIDKHELVSKQWFIKFIIYNCLFISLVLCIAFLLGMPFQNTIL